MLFHQLKKYGLTVLVLLAGMMLANILMLSLPWGLKLMIDHMGYPGHREQLAGLLGILFLAVIGKALLQGIIRKKAGQVAEEITAELAQKVYEKALQLSFLTVRRYQPAQLAGHLTSDLETLRRFSVLELLEAVYSFLSIGLALTVLFYLHAGLACVAFGVVVFCSVFLSQALPRLKDHFVKLKTLQSALAARVMEVFNGVVVVQAHQTQGHELDRYSKEIQRVANHAVEHYAMNGALTSRTDIFLGMALVLILGLGGGFMADWRLSPGTLAAFYSYTLMLFGPVIKMSNMGSSCQLARVSWERIQTFLAMPSDSPRSSGVIHRTQVNGHLSVDHVFYHYPGGPCVIQDVSLQVHPGETLGIVGQSGAGKSTLVYLLSGLLPADQGTIRLGSLDIQKIDRKMLAKSLGVVFQEDYLFTGSIRDNIRYGYFEASDLEIRSAAKAAGAQEFIEGLPNGFETVITERGSNLSGGQRQRLALARALVRQPKVLILDETTCALDALTENAVQSAIRHYCPQAAIILVAHRFSTLMDAHRIVVMENGQIVQEGGHNYLLSREGLYSTLYWEQFKTLTT